MIKKCVICGNEFNAYKTAKTCSPECSRELKRLNNKRYWSNKSKSTTKNHKRRKQRKPRGGARQLKEKGSLCWQCKHAVPSLVKKTGCSWSISFKPIPGWDAKEVFSVRDGEKVPCGYMVKSCPQFEKEA